MTCSSDVRSRSQKRWKYRFAAGVNVGRKFDKDIYVPIKNGGVKMWTKAKSFAILFTAALFCCVSPPYGSCSASPAEETAALTVSKRDWMQLKRNNDEQRKALEESQTALSEANAALNASRAALDESGKELEASKAELEALRKEYEQQKAELMMLKEELRTQKNESATASDALTQANKFLADTKAEIEAREAFWRKREAQLERQRLLYQVILAGLVVGGVAIAA